MLGSVFCVLELQVPDGGDGRCIFQRSSPPKKQGVPFRGSQQGAVPGYVIRGKHRSYFVVES